MTLRIMLYSVIRCTSLLDTHLSTNSLIVILLAELEEFGVSNYVSAIIFIHLQVVVAKEEELVEPHTRVAGATHTVSRQTEETCQRMYRVQRQPHNAGTAKEPE